MKSTKEARRVNFDLNKEELEYFRDELRLGALIKRSFWKTPNKVVKLENLDFKNQKIIIAIYNNLFTTMIIDYPTTYYYRSVEDICIPIITRFD